MELIYKHELFMKERVNMISAWTEKFCPLIRSYMVISLFALFNTLVFIYGSHSLKLITVKQAFMKANNCFRSTYSPVDFILYLCRLLLQPFLIGATS